MNKTDPLKLAERVEAGEQPQFTTDYGLGDDNHAAVYRALLGCLSSARALHYEVLPEWEWGLDWLDGSQMAYVRKDMTLIEAQGPNPAAAWVSAILRAKAEQAHE